MLFKLTVLLVAGIGLAMYFAPDLPETHRAVIAERSMPPATEPAPAPAPATSEGAAGDAAPEPALVTDAPPAMSATDPEPTGTDRTAAFAAQADLPAGTPAQSAAAETSRGSDLGGAADPVAGGTGSGAEDRLAPLVIEGLSGGDTAAALSLSERIRQRIETERAAAEVATEAAAEPAPQAPLIPGGGPALSGPDVLRAQVVGTSVNLRGGPSTANPVVGRVSFGDELDLLGEASPGWSRIRHPETGEDAFMASRFLQPLEN